MKAMLWGILCGAIHLAAAVQSAAPPIRDTSYLDTTGEGQALVEDLLTRMPLEDSQILGLLKIRRPDQPMIEIPIKMTIRLGTNSWHDIYETQPVHDRPGEIFIVEHRGRQPNRYLHGRFRDRAEEPELKPLDQAALYQPFAGSDFFFADLGLEFFHWPSHKIVKKEMRKGRSCRVVESTNPHPQPGGYSRVRSWLDFETGNIILAEGYDANNRKLKEFSIAKISRSGGKARIKKIEIRNDQTDSRTLLEFNLEIDDN
jgi:hypothetical protein